MLEYWVVDLDGGRVVVDRDPRPDGYAQRTELCAGDRVAAGSVRLPALDVAELLRAADG